MPAPRLVIHGGCGVIPRAGMSAAREAGFRASLRASLEAGWAVLARGGASMDAVVAAIAVMEDDPNFNAGHGSAFNADGGHELDASIMEGTTLHAGSVASTRRIRNPIRVVAELARRGSDPLMLAGEGADRWAERNGFAMVDNAHFATEWRREALREIKAREDAGTMAAAPESEKHGTVGAVACDQNGHIAAATSTGGITNKQPGRVGDSPIIGAGCYADDATCAVSSTGTGEMFIRLATAHDVAAQMAYRGASLADAAHDVVMNKLPRLAGRGGIIAVDAQGNVAMPFNTEGMYRGYARVGEVPVVGIYSDDAA